MKQKGIIILTMCCIKVKEITINLLMQGASSKIKGISSSSSSHFKRSKWGGMIEDLQLI